VDDMLKMTRRKLVEQKYPYAINSRTNGRVITTVREDGKLKQISAVTMDDMLNKLYLFYFENKKNLTLNDLFPEWKAERLNDKSLNIKTVRRDNEHWNKYYKEHSIINVSISKLNTKIILLLPIRDILGQVDEKTTLSYIYNPNTEQENLNIMNEALKKSDKISKKK